jgi:hypothetical protein
MYIMWTTIVFLFVIGVLAVVGWALFEMSPFAHHADRFRDPETGKWTAGSLRLDEPDWLDRPD